MFKIKTRKVEVDRLWAEYLVASRSKDRQASRAAYERYCAVAFPSWEEGKARDYICKKCGGRPPTVTYDHFKDSTVCIGCMNPLWGLEVHQALLLALIGGAIFRVVLALVLGACVP